MGRGWRLGFWGGLRSRLHGDGPVLHVLLEATLVVEDLVADGNVLHPGAEEEPEEEAVDPAHQAGHEGAAGGEREVRPRCQGREAAAEPQISSQGCWAKGVPLNGAGTHPGAQDFFG